MRRVRRRHRLRRRRLDGVQVGPAERPPQAGQHDLGHERHAETRVCPPCNPALPQGRPSRRERLDAPLVYERLSDPILVTRAKAGDKRGARGALRAARAAGRAARAPSAARPRGRTRRDPGRRSRSSSSGSASSGASRSSRPGCTASSVNTCKDFAQARAVRRTEPLVRRRAARPATATRSRRSPRPRRAASSARCLAELPPAQATVVALKDAFDVGFAEISEVTGLPVGTAKCYAHRGRASLRAHPPQRMTELRSAARPRSSGSSPTARRSSSSTRWSSWCPASGSPPRSS